MTNTGFARSVWICAALLAGCSPQPEKKNAESEKVEVQQPMVHEQAVVRNRVMPPDKGVFLIHNDAFQQVQPGEQDWLMPTNAERGFGFAVPNGVVIYGGERFAIQSDTLNLSQIQVTSYRGIAVNSGAWIDDVDDANVAWIPGAVIEADVDVIDEERGLVNVAFSKPLPPGLYVLHDETMITARQKSDVDVYYPFIVRSDGHESPWAENAENCFERIYEKFGESMKLDDPDNLDVKELKRCAQAQRIARKMAKASGESDADPFLRTLYLGRLLDSRDLNVHRHILAAMNASGNRLEQILWRIENQDQIWRLMQLRSQIEDGVVSADVVSSALDFYESHSRIAASLKKEDSAREVVVDAKSDVKNVKRDGWKVDDSGADVEAVRPDAVSPDGSDSPRTELHIGQGAERGTASISLMSWLPFAKLSSTEPELEKLMHQMNSGENWDLSLVDILAAIQLREIQKEVRLQKALSGWYKKLEPKIAPEIRQMAGKLQGRSPETRVSFGPYLFEGVPEREISTWRATAASVENSVTACFKVHKGENGAVFILDQPLNGAAYGRDAHGTLRDPLDSLRKKPVIDPKVVECILNAYGELPAAPALNTTQRVKIAVTVADKE